MKRPRYKRLREIAWELCREIVKLRDDEKCSICGAVEDLQVDHCFSRTCGMLFYVIENLTLLCSKCHFLKSKRKGGPTDKMVDGVVQRREGKVWWAWALAESWKSNSEICKVWWLEDLIENLKEKKEFWKKRYAT